MKRFVFLLIIIYFSAIIVATGQTKLMPNFVSTQEFETDRDIWPTFTQGVVHYQAHIMYIYGELFVTSTMPDEAEHTKPNVRSTYLMPIYSQYKKNQGKIHPDYDDEMYLFLDIKYDPRKTYQKLWEQLAPYSEMLTYRVGPQWNEGKLRVIFVGNAPMRTFMQERVGFVGAQGTIADLDKDYDNKVMPLIGIDFRNDIEWSGVGKMSFDEYRSLREIVNRAHKQGKKVRVYNLPDEEEIWDVMYTAGIDLISGSDPARFQKFLESKQ